MYSRMSITFEPDSPAWVVREKRGSTIMICGTLMAATKPLRMKEFPLNT